MRTYPTLRTAGKVCGVVTLVLGAILALGAASGCRRERRINYYRTYDVRPSYDYYYYGSPRVVYSSPSRRVVVTPRFDSHRHGSAIGRRDKGWAGFQGRLSPQRSRQGSRSAWGGGRRPEGGRGRARSGEGRRSRR